MDPELVRAAGALLADVRGAGYRVAITDGYRSPEKQREAAERKPGLALPAGSKHGLGRALDLDSSEQGLAYAARVAPKYGLRFPRPVDDPYHVELP